MNHPVCNSLVLFAKLSFTLGRFQGIWTLQWHHFGLFCKKKKWKILSSHSICEKSFSKRKGWRHTIWKWHKMSPKNILNSEKWKQTIFKHYASRMSDWKIVNSCKVKVKVIFQTFPKYFSWYVFSLIWIEAFLFPTQQHRTYAEGGKNMSSCFICQCLLGSILSS